MCPAPTTTLRPIGAGSRPLFDPHGSTRTIPDSPLIDRRGRTHAPDGGKYPEYPGGDEGGEGAANTSAAAVGGGTPPGERPVHTVPEAGGRALCTVFPAGR
ncbi:hypothetical protein GCM10023336_73740 [Streptomyces similanensis]|uniref:Uncharacterized protein n=1 Tax=Streptomyces similanensis TaxID=1274988 RepID=A0ABP9LPJ1_9ACTN